MHTKLPEHAISIPNLAGGAALGVVGDAGGADHSIIGGGDIRVIVWHAPLYVTGAVEGNHVRLRDRALPLQNGEVFHVKHCTDYNVRIYIYILPLYVKQTKRVTVHPSPFAKYAKVWGTRPSGACCQCKTQVSAKSGANLGHPAVGGVDADYGDGWIAIGIVVSLGREEETTSNAFAGRWNR